MNSRWISYWTRWPSAGGSPEVELNCEYLPATDNARQELVLLHGWGSSPAVWRTLLAGMRPWANIRLLEVPGCAPGAHCSGEEAALEEVLLAILQVSPPQAVYVGWSLGGQLALELAARYPQRVAALVAVCSNPRFVAEEGWPGMQQQAFAAFGAAASADLEAALRRFDSLQVSGSPQARQCLRQLQSCARKPATVHLLQGLNWLGSLDQRQLLPRLQQPQLHLLGDRDELVPPALADQLRVLLAQTSGARVALLEQCSHVATLDAPAALVSKIHGFVSEAGLLGPAVGQPEQLAKREVADSFSRAAQLYDSVAQLQRDVGEQLLTRLDALGTEPDSVLDLGCGTGYFCAGLKQRFPQADYYGLDIAQGMVEYAREGQPRAQGWLVGDAEALPLANNSVDLVFSSLAIQWCYRPQLLFAELARVLRPGGYCVFSSLGPGTLQELRAAWATVDKHQHVNEFLPTAVLASAAREIPGVKLSLQSSEFCMHYQAVRDLLRELKTLGAHNMNHHRPSGLTSRRALQGMLQAYEQWREQGLLPATYDVIFGVVQS